MDMPLKRVFVYVHEFDTDTAPLREVLKKLSRESLNHASSFDFSECVGAVTITSKSLLGLAALGEMGVAGVHEGPGASFYGGLRKELVKFIG